MGSRKRSREEMDSSEPPTEESLLDKIRSQWEFANLMQYIFVFGKAVKIDEDLTIEVRHHLTCLISVEHCTYAHLMEFRMLIDNITKDLEIECVKPEPSQVLSDIGLALLKYVSSHRGLK